MSYKLVKNLTTVNYTKGNKGRKYIVIHYTGNKTDTAAANANYFKSVNRGASAHYFVDRTQVVQVVEDSNTAWSVGVNYGSNNLFNQCKNNNSINIEMCSTNGKIADETYNNTVALTKSLMKKYGIPASRVVRHWDVCSKACPGWVGWGAAGKDASIWNKFKKDIGDTSTSSNTSSSSSSNSTNSSKAVNYKVKINTKSGVNVRKGAGTGYGIIKAIANGTTCTITKESNGWGYAKEYGGWISLQYTQKITTTSSSNTSSNGGSTTIKNAQKAINSFCNAGLAVDGLMGPKTRNGIVKALQTALNKDYRAGLAVDGIRGTKTNAALGNHYVKRGETQYLVTFVEIALAALGYYSGSIERPGIFGSGLETATYNFQKATGLSADKIAGKNTILKMLTKLGC